MRIYFDKLPDTAEKCSAFKGYVVGLNSNARFRQAGIHIRSDQLAEIDSKEHVILQALDTVLGAMQFRLNDKHKEIPVGAKKRGNRTLAKERVYKKILAEISSTRASKRFNIGINTGDGAGVESRWGDGHRHWIFKPKEGAIRPEFSKRKAAAPKK